MKKLCFVPLLIALFAFQASATLAQTKVIVITSGTTWTVPGDWGSTSNTIEVIGAGGNGNPRCSLFPQTIGGGGGAYSKITNLVEAPGATVNIHIGGESGGNQVSGVGDGTWVGSAVTVYAESGWDGGDCGNPGRGGASANGVGTVKFTGGIAALGSGLGNGVGSGGGAAGPHGAGGTPTPSGLDFVGGVGDNGFGGAGGTTAPGVGGAGTEMGGGVGAGGGGGANASIGGGAGGLYGGGAGYNNGTATSGPGGPGLIVITYTARRRVSAGVFD